jgi:hypothetical protein
MAAAPVLALLLLSALAGAAAGGDIVHHDDEAPKIPGCNNDFILVSKSYPESNPFPKWPDRIQSPNGGSTPPDLTEIARLCL